METFFPDCALSSRIGLFSPASRSPRSLTFVHQAWSSLAAQSLSDLGRGSTSIFAPAGSPAHSVFGLSMLVLAVCTAIFLAVGGLLLYVVVRYRHRAHDANASQEPPQIYGSNQIELSWTVIPILIVVMLFLATARIILATQDHPRPADGPGWRR